MCIQKCKFWFWEDEVSARSTRGFNGRRELDSPNQDGHVHSSKVVQGIKDLQTELLLIRFAVIALALAVVWLGSRV
jgi:hypothetical protein